MFRIKFQKNIILANGKHYFSEHEDLGVYIKEKNSKITVISPDQPIDEQENKCTNDVIYDTQS
jgi:hypothetical protein